MRALLAILLSLVCGVSAASATEWPKGAKAAVVLTYDDALTSQLDHAVPVLDRAGLKATFFLARVKRADVPRWRAAAARGHEMANHTIFHPCSAASYPEDPRYTTESYTPASLLREIEQQNVFLTALDGRTRRGFATPCGQTKAGGADYLEPLRTSGLVTYVRSASWTPADLEADASTMDLMNVPARSFPETATGAELIAFAQEAEATGGLAVFLFHGVSGDYLQVSDAAHRQLVAWLKAHRRDVWVTTLQEALDWARTHPSRARRTAVAAP